MIVLNGEPFLRYNLRALYPFAHEIIVVEGAAPAAAGIATPDGHSQDGTIQTLLEFKAQEDVDNKIIIVTAENEGHPNGFWPGEKLEQSQAYAKRARGNWLWQVDVDEFYQSSDMDWITRQLLTRNDIHVVSFKQIQFWGSLNYYVDGWYLRHYGGEVFYRLFRWERGYTYTNHRPPTVNTSAGDDLRKLGWIRSSFLAERGIYLYHYSSIFPHQVAAKSAYYARVEWGEFGKMQEWAATNYERLRNPYRVHNVYRYPSWLEYYKGKHPEQVLAMWEDIQNSEGSTPFLFRRTDDISRLIASPRYKMGKFVLKLTGIIICNLRKLTIRMFRLLPPTLRVFLKQAVGRA
jgi:hypothetical protein